MCKKLSFLSISDIDLDSPLVIVRSTIKKVIHFTTTAVFSPPEQLSSHSKEAGLVIYLAFLAKVANLYYTMLTAFKKYWPDTLAKFISGTQKTFI